MKYISNTDLNYKTLKMSVKRIFEQVKTAPASNGVDLWKMVTGDPRDYKGELSKQTSYIIKEMQDSVIKGGKPDGHVLSDPFEKGLAVTINFHVRHNRNRPLIADDYQAPVFKIIHIFRESLMRHARVFVSGCFEIDLNGLLHVHFIIDGRKLRNLSEKEVYAYDRAIKFITGRVLGRDDVLVKEVRNIGFFKYLLKTIKTPETSERFFKYFIPIIGEKHFVPKKYGLFNRTKRLREENQCEKKRKKHCIRGSF